MSDLGRLFMSVPIQVRRVSGMIETAGIETTVNFAELWIIDETHHDGFRVLCGLDLDTGTLFSPHGDLWSQ